MAVETKLQSSFHAQPRRSLIPRQLSLTTRTTLHNLSTSTTSTIASPTFCLTALLLLSAFGLTLERRTVVGKALSAPLATMALALIVANLGVIPFESPVYSAVNQFLVPLAIPLLLLDSDLRRVGRETGSLLACFGVGALATVLGTLVAFFCIPLQALGVETGWKIACALAARHIGGAINFVAVAETLQIPGSAVSAAIAACGAIEGDRRKLSYVTSIVLIVAVPMIVIQPWLIRQQNRSLGRDDSKKVKRGHCERHGQD